jgi:hypothetical protein
MPDDLDDFEIQRTPQKPTEELGPTGREPWLVEPAGEGGSRAFPLTLAAIAVVAFGVLVALFLVFRQPGKPKAVEAPVAPGPVASASLPSPASTHGPLPELDASDDFVRRLAAGLSSHAELARWLAQPSLVRTLAVVVTNVAEGETPRPHLGFLAPQQRFRAKGAPGRRVVADPAGFAGYDRFADAVGSIDVPAAVSAYRALEPLFDAAARDLGHPEGFRGGLDRALRALVSAPVPPADAELLPHATGFRYADPRLEGLTAAQKQFLRLGPRNVALVQAKLREVQAALGGAEASPPAQPAP